MRVLSLSDLLNAYIHFMQMPRIIYIDIFVFLEGQTSPLAQSIRPKIVAKSFHITKGSPTFGLHVNVDD